MLPESVSCVYVRQPEALGLGHAVLCAAPVVREEPFAVILADDLIDGGERNCLAQMLSVYDQHQCSMLGVEQVPASETDKYGIVKSVPIADRVNRVERIIEKPSPDHAPSQLAVVGRYILTPRIFELLRTTARGAGGEIQLTDAIASAARAGRLSYQFSGKRYDCGSKLGYLRRRRVRTEARRAPGGVPRVSAILLRAPAGAFRYLTFPPPRTCCGGPSLPKRRRSPHRFFCRTEISQAVRSARQL